jgi:predicted amidohydrolase YtcJ
MNARLWRLVLPAIFGAVCLQGTAVASDVLLLHGHIYTGNPQAASAEALSVTGSRIDAVGTDKEISKRRSTNTHVIDLRGHTVIPGIVDSHTHVLFGAIELQGFNLSTPEASITPDNPRVLVARIKEYAASHPSDKILFGRADFSAAPPYTPTHELLDQAVSDRAVVVHNTSEHALWLNAKALALAGVTDQPVADPLEERYVIRDASGQPSGVLIEAAMELMERALRAQLPVEQQLAWLRDATRYLNRYGITSVVNMTGDLEEIRLYAALRDRGQLTVRTRTAFGAVAFPHRLTPQFLADLEEARTKYHDEWVSANLVKFFADGSTGLIPPLVYEPAKYKALVMELDRRGYQLATHAQRGDSVHLILDAYEDAVRTNGPRDRRLRIEHDLVVQNADIPRYTALSVIAGMQPVFCCTEMGTNYDPKETTPSDEWRAFKKAEVVLAFSSDWPCSWPPDPFISIQQAVMRQIWHSDDTANVLGQPMDGAAQGGARPTGQIYSPEQRITVREAIDAYTRGSAYAAFSDTRVGTLELGKEADIAVLSQDVFTVPPEQIGKTHVVMTMVGGKTVYEETN